LDYICYVTCNHWLGSWQTGNEEYGCGKLLGVVLSHEEKDNSPEMEQ
jgi:hypothetical protein